MSRILLSALWLLLICAKTTTAQINIALNKTTRCSSVENGGFTATGATDGLGTGLQISNSGSCTGTCTRWSSGFSDPQWLWVDLGAYYTISSVKLYWEVANGKDFKIQVGVDTVNWTTVQTVTSNSAFSNTYPVNNVFGRYVRMYGTARNTPYGFSLWEMEVYGTFIVLPVKLSNFAATASPSPTGVSLSWKTYTDALTNFIIERSSDGTHFIAVGSVAVSSNTTNHFIDINPIHGKNYYRLKWTERGSSTISYSEIVTVNTSEKYSVSIFPNPIYNGVISGTLSQSYSGLLTLKLYNASGILIHKQEQYLTNSNHFTATINNTLPKGIYWLDVVQTETTAHLKIMVE